MPPPLKQPSRDSVPSDVGAQTFLRPNLVVAERYRLIEPLGTGSMGAVWRARHVMLGHMVAIKFLHASVDVYPDGQSRFEREARLSAQLSEASRHVCRVHDFGVIGAGIPFVVMELLVGEELSVRLRRERVLELPVIVDIVNQLCRALEVAHRAGVVHRDLKPANVFLCTPDEGQRVFVKLLDFGVAKAPIEQDDSQATRAGTILGTPGYMSPEQITGDVELDGRADLWAVAVMVYRMATGRTPFGAGTLSELALRILTATPAWPSTRRPGLPTSVDEWMVRALAKNRDERFSNAGEMARALATATQHTIVAGTDAAVPLEPPSDESTCVAAYKSQVAPADSVVAVRKVRWQWGAAIGVVVAASLVLSLATGNAPDPTQNEHRLARRAAATPIDATKRPKLTAGSPQETARPTPPPGASITAPVAATAAAPAHQATDEATAPVVSSAAASARRATDEATAPVVSSAAPKPAPRRAPAVRAPARAARAAPPVSPQTKAAQPSAVETRASQLWNKRDEL